MKISDYAPYEKCVKEITTTELVQLSNNPRNEGMFMNFIRYVDLLGPTDMRKLKG